MSRRLVTLAHWLVLAVLLGAVATAGAWRLTGGRWERVETASMGTVAPVNTLLWVEPASFETLRTGDFITFHPPGHPDLTYSHRVAAVDADGTIQTQGEITARDPWRLTRGDLVGKVVMRWKGVGWLIVAAPVLLGGGLILWVLVWSVRGRTWRAPVAIVGGAVLLSVAIVVYRPLIRAEQLGFGAAPEGARATYVSTGLAPIRLHAYQGAHVDLGDGEVGSVVITQRDAHGRYAVTVHPHLPPWWWLVIVVVCFLPALWTLAIGQPDRPAAPHAPTHRMADRALDRSLRPAR
ncbi:MAG TPA: S26 family signal peptidase [Nocardioides sp.]|nr:S26 family signal peptidase [Nocardioides sp.]